MKTSGCSDGSQQQAGVTKVIAFDVNETLLDLSSLDTPFMSLLGSAALRGQWFAQMLQLSFVGGLTDDYVDFSTAQRAAFLMVAARNHVTISEDDATEIVSRMNSLPAHPDVAAALDSLSDSSFTVVALVNSLEKVGEEQLTNAGIRTYFDHVISADSVRRLKPAREPYLAVAAAFNVDIAEVRLVSAHSWDISGALAAGCKAAFVARPGMVLSPLGRQPDIVGVDLGEVVDKIVTLDSR